MEKIDPTPEGMMNWFRKFKLNSMVFSERATFPIESMENTHIDTDKMAKNQMTDKLAQHILNHERMYMEKEVDMRRGTINYKFQLIAVQPGELKTVVEAVISMLSDDQIRFIKSGKRLIDVVDEGENKTGGAGDSNL